MKTIALSMLFSLAVILCEQQTLFAPHITTFEGLTAANPLTNGRCLERRIVGGTMCSAFADDSPPNSLVPIAGVNRLIPVPGTDSFKVNKAHYSTQNPSDKETDPAAVDVLQPKDGVSLYDHLRGEEDQPKDGVSLYDHIRGEEDQPKDGVSLYDHIRGEEDSFIHAREW